MSYEEACKRAWTWWINCNEPLIQFRKVVTAIAKKYNKDYYDVREKVLY
jgi:hypothetical protein